MKTDDQDRVTELNLRNNGLSGAIPADLGRLSHLELLWLESNQLTGEIPRELTDLSNLRQFLLHENQLTGEIPPEIGKLSSLEILRLNQNRLWGSLPAELRQLNEITVLDLAHNDLIGELSPELGELSNLTNLRLDFNRLGGEVPFELTDLKQLKTLFLSRNPGLTGCLPDDLLDIEDNDLRELDLQSCEALERGVLATFFEALDGGNWTNNDGWLSDAPPGQWHGVSTGPYGRVTSIDLTDNDVSGKIPTALSHLARLHQLRLSGNQIAGCLPLALLSVPDNDFNILGVPECPPPVTMDDVRALAWFEDGLNDDETWAVNHLQSFIGSEDDLDRRLADQVVHAGWFTDGITSNEAWTMGVLADIVTRYRQVLPAVVEFKWAFDDDLPRPELNTVTRVRDLELFDPGTGVLLVELPWLYDGISDSEDWALAGLRHMAEFGPGQVARIIEIPWFADGPNDFESRGIAHLRRFIGSTDSFDRRLAEQMVNAGWFNDGLVWEEYWTMGVLADIAANYRHVLPAIVEFNWAFDDDLTWPEGQSITKVRDLAEISPGLAIQIVGLPWVADGITYAESHRVDGIGNVLAAASTLDRDYSGLLSLLVDEPVGAYRPLEIMLMRAFGQIPEEQGGRRKLLEDLVNAHWFEDGLTDVERVHIIGLSSDQSRYRELPNLNTAIIRSGTFDLPLAGDVTMWFVGDGAIPPAWIMENLEEAARGVEELMREPFPFSALVVALVDRLDYDGGTRTFAARSFHEGQRIEIIDGLSDKGMRDVIHHEVAHTYFNNLVGAEWFTEAGAEYFREYIQGRKGYAVEDPHVRIRSLVRNDCTAYGVLQIREALIEDPEIPHECKYKIGLHLLLRMEKAAGFDAMTAALTELYRTAMARGVANSDREIYEAFLNNAPAGTEPQVQEVWDQIYGPFAEGE